jgi:putative transposase
VDSYLRKRNRLERVAYLGPRAHFLTICTGGRAKRFSDPKLVILLIDVLQESCAAHLFQIYAYCFMPDHLHLILVGTNDSSDLSAVIQSFKGKSTAAARKVGITELWQKGFYDHILRSGESLDAAAGYVFMNPVRAGFARQAKEWAGSGSFVFKWEHRQISQNSFVPPWKATTASDEPEKKSKMATAGNDFSG